METLADITARLQQTITETMPEVIAAKPAPPVVYDLRPYQEVILQKMLETSKGTSCSELVVLPTGAGKTVVSAAFVDAMLKMGHRGMMLTPRKILESQTSEKMTAMGVPHTFYSGGHVADMNADFFVGSSQTVQRRGWPPGLTFVIVDEAHMDFEMPPAGPPLWWGLTATPEWGDGSGMGDRWKTMIVGPPPSELIASGAVLPARVFAPFIPDVKDLKILAGEFTEESASLVMNGIIKDVVVHWMQLTPGKTTVLFASSVKLAEDVALLFRQAGIPAECVHATSKPSYRKEVFAKLADGRVKVLCNVGIAGLGWDMPAVEVVVLWVPIYSLPRYLQNAGRGSRPYGEQKNYILLDFAGNWVRHGLPHSDRQWSLTKEKKVRKESLTSSEVRVCPQCFLVLAKEEVDCPVCGPAAPKARRQKYVEGELREVFDEPPNTPMVLAQKHRHEHRKQIIGIAMYQKNFARMAAVRYAENVLNAYDKRLVVNPDLSWSDYLVECLLLKGGV